MAVDPFRFLGLAFATADLLIEVDEAGAISFAAGAGQRLARIDDAGLIGRPWLELFAPVDRPLADALLAGLVDGERRGLDKLALAADDHGVCRAVCLSAFRLPQIAPRVSCALTLIGRATGDRVPRERLFDRTEFEAAARSLIEASKGSGQELELGLIEFGGLAQERRKLSPEAAQALDLRVAGALRAESYGDAATDLGDQRYAVIRRKGDTPEAVAKRLTRVLGARLAPTAQSLSIESSAAPGRLMRALRFAIDGFIADGSAGEAADLQDVLNSSVKKAVADAGEFGAIVEARRFKLVYQPVVSLADRKVRHYEALVRFSDDESPFAMIRMAEELDIIEDLDRAVAEEAARKLRSDQAGRLLLAVNVSGRSIVSPSYVEGLVRFGRPLASRLMLEITESAAIHDLGLAQRHIHALQATGFKVCLDDFGAGAASFAYLQQLNVDVVKIDGSYVRELTSSGRDDAMIRHLVNLCRELRVETVAEMVETRPVEEQLRRAGVDYAQGWLYGQPLAEPHAALEAPPTPVAARRAGVKEQWG